MIGNFDSEITSNVWVFLEEGDVSELEEDALEGNLYDISNGDEFGMLSLVYGSAEDFDFVPRVERMDEDIVVEITDEAYDMVEKDRVYRTRIGDLQDFSREAKIWVFPPENQGRHEYMMNDLQFYSNNEEIEAIRENYK